MDKNTLPTIALAVSLFMAMATGWPIMMAHDLFESVRDVFVSPPPPWHYEWTWTHCASQIDRCEIKGSGGP